MRKCLWGVMAIIAIAVSGCGTPAQRIVQVQETARRNQPMVEWVLVRPEHLADVDPARLKAEGAALVIMRGIKENASGERMGAVEGVALRNVSTSTVRLGQMQRAGDEDEIGWGVIIVPPGQYTLNRGNVQQLVRIGAAGVRSTTSDVNGHPYVPLSSTIRIAPGEVVYVGTVVWQVRSPSDRQPKVRIRDERSAAAKWTATHLPAFAGQMQTHILPPPVEPLS